LNVDLNIGLIMLEIPHEFKSKEIVNCRNYTASILYERKTRLKYWWRHTDRETPKYAHRNLSTCRI